VYGEEEVVVGVELLAEVARQLVEPDELGDLVELPLVARAPRVELLDELRNLAEDAGRTSRRGTRRR